MLSFLCLPSLVSLTRFAGDHAELHGALSTNLREDFNTDGSLRALRRSGFCGMRTNVRSGDVPYLASHTLTRLRTWNWTWRRMTRSSSACGCAGLAERARGSELRRGSQGDGRKYVATLRTDAWINVPVRGWHLPHADGLC